MNSKTALSFDVGPCRYCAAPAAFGFDIRIARLRTEGTIWACAMCRAGLPSKGKGGREMDSLQSFEDDEADDLASAADALARHWKTAGLGEHVAAIGREAGLEGAKVLLGTYFELRARRLEVEHAEARRDAPPF